MAIEDLKLNISADPTPALRYFNALREAALAASVSISQASQQAAAVQQAAAQQASRAVGQMGVAAEAAAESVEELTDATQELANAAHEVGQEAKGATEGLEEMDAAAAETASSLDRAASRADDTKDALDRLERPLTTTGSKFKTLEGIVTQWANRAHMALRNFEQAALGLGAASGAIFLAIGGMVKTFADFEAVMNGVQAVSGATAKEMEDLTARALQLGADTQFSAKEAAQAFFELAKAGFSVEQQMSAVEGVMQLAAAGSLSVGEAAEISGGILKGFGMDVSEAAKVADQLAQAANSSALDVTDVAMSMKYIAPVAKATGQSLEEITGALALLGDRAIKGEMGGTSLRGIISALISPSEAAAKEIQKLGIAMTDTQGKTLQLSAIIGQFRDKTAQMTEAERAAAIERIVGRESLSAFLALMTTSDEVYQNYIDNQKNATGAAQTMSDGINRGLNYQLEQLKGSIETLAIKIGNDLAPAVGKINGVLTAFVNLLGTIPAPIRVAGEALAVFAGIAFSLSAALGALKAMLPMLLAGFSALTGPVGLAVLGISAAATAIGLLVSGIKDKTRAAAADVAQTRRQIDTVNTLAARFQELQEKTSRTKAEEDERRAILEKLERISPDLVSAYNAEGEATRINTERLAAFNAELREKLRLQQQEVASKFQEATTAHGEAKAKLTSLVEQHRIAEQTEKALQAALEKSKKTDEELRKRGLLAAGADSIGTVALEGRLRAAKEATSALAAQVAAQRTVVAAAEAAWKAAQGAVWEAEGRKRSKAAATATAGKTPGAVKGARGEELTGYALIKARFDADKISTAEFIALATAEQRKFNATSKEYLDIAKDIAEARRQAEADQKRKQQEAKQADQQALQAMRERHNVAMALTAEEEDEGKRLVAQRKALNDYLAELQSSKADPAEIRRVRAAIAKIDRDFLTRTQEVQKQILAIEREGHQARRRALQDLLLDLVNLEGVASAQRLGILDEYLAESKAAEEAVRDARKLENAAKAEEMTKALRPGPARDFTRKQLQDIFDENTEAEYRRNIARIEAEGQAAYTSAAMSDLTKKASNLRSILADLGDADVNPLGSGVEAALLAYEQAERQVAEVKKAALDRRAQKLLEDNPEAARQRNLVEHGFMREEDWIAQHKDLATKLAAIEQAKAHIDQTLTTTLEDIRYSSRADAIRTRVRGGLDKAREALEEALDPGKNPLALGVTEALAQVEVFQRHEAALRKGRLDRAIAKLKAAYPEETAELEAQAAGILTGELSEAAKRLKTELEAINLSKQEIDQALEATIKRQREGIQKQASSNLLQTVDRLAGIASSAANLLFTKSFDPVEETISGYYARTASSLVDLADQIAMATGNAYAIIATKAVKIVVDIWSMAEQRAQEARKKMLDALEKASQTASRVYETAITRLKGAFSIRAAIGDLEMAEDPMQRAARVADANLAEYELNKALLDKLDDLRKQEEDALAKKQRAGLLREGEYQEALAAIAEKYASKRIQTELDALAKIKAAQDALLNAAADRDMKRAAYQRGAAIAKGGGPLRSQRQLEADLSRLEDDWSHGRLASDEATNNRIYWDTKRRILDEQIAHVVRKLETVNPNSKRAQELRAELNTLEGQAAELGKASVQQATNLNDAMSNLSKAIGNDKGGIVKQFGDLGGKLEALAKTLESKKSEERANAPAAPTSANARQGVGEAAKTAERSQETVSKLAAWSADMDWAESWTTGYFDTARAGKSLRAQLEAMKSEGSIDDATYAVMDARLRRLRNNAIAKWSLLIIPPGGPIAEFAQGGIVPGVGNQDTVPAMLTPGEMVLPKALSERLLAAASAGHRATSTQIASNVSSRNIAVNATINLGGVHVGSEADARSLARRVAPEIARLVREQLA